MSNGRFIAYYRVSTARQGKSGLGLEAQRAAVQEHLNGGRWRLIEEVTEIESGKPLLPVGVKRETRDLHHQQPAPALVCRNDVGKTGQ